MKSLTSTTALSPQGSAGAAGRPSQRCTRLSAILPSPGRTASRPLTERDWLRPHRKHRAGTGRGRHLLSGDGPDAGSNDFGLLRGPAEHALRCVLQLRPEAATRRSTFFLLPVKLHAVLDESDGVFGGVDLRGTRQHACVARV